MFSNGTVVFLNILVTLFLYFIRIQDPKPYSHFKMTSQKAYFSHLCLYKGYNGKWIKNVIFHDFFKLLLDGLRWCFGCVEMFLGSLKGILSSIIDFGFVYDSQWKSTFSPQHVTLPQYCGKIKCWGENNIFHCKS